MGTDLKDLEIVNHSFHYLKKKIEGAVLITIVPPQNLLHPFLLYKTRGGKTILTLCKLCCEKFSSNCCHSDQERALTGSYMISEIEYALKLNYQILEIYECHAYFNSKPIFKEFVEALDYYKQINSMSATDVSPELCKYLNLTRTAFKFEQSAFQKNLSKRNFYKLAANALFGKI